MIGHHNIAVKGNVVEVIRNADKGELDHFSQWSHDGFPGSDATKQWPPLRGTNRHEVRAWPSVVKMRQAN